MPVLRALTSMVSSISRARCPAVPPLADDAEADVLLHDLRAFIDQVLLQQHHEEIDSSSRALPVLGLNSRA